MDEKQKQISLFKSWLLSKGFSEQELNDPFVADIIDESIELSINTRINDVHLIQTYSPHELLLHYANSVSASLSIWLRIASPTTGIAYRNHRLSDISLRKEGLQSLSDRLSDLN